MTGSEIRIGNIIEFKNRLCQVLKLQHTQHGRGGATIQAELRDIQSGLKSSERLRTAEAIERVFVDEVVYTYLYREGDHVCLMEPSTFEQVTVPSSFFGEGVVYLRDGMEVTVNVFNGQPLSATVPPRVTCTVAEAEPYFKGQTATAVPKKVILDNGLHVQVPSFVVEGDQVVIDTSDNSYITRSKS